MSAPDTIYATSSGSPPAAIAIIRISGPDAFAVGTTLAGSLPQPRRAALRALHDPLDGALLDRALVLVFPAPRTATGEDLVEFHVHGGRAVVASVEAAIGSMSGTRLANPGEYTRRALENGVIDLTAAEGLGDLLSAHTETQRRAALRMAEGGVRILIEGWTDVLIGIAADIEAQLDFSDTDDVAMEDVDATRAKLAAVFDEIAAIVSAPAVERLHEGVRVVIAGPPNSGKSTLINALVGRDVAIVSAISGTTRDRIEAPVIRNGTVYILTDTAGLTDTPGDEVEAIGIARASAAIASADIVLWLDDSPVPDPTYIALHARADEIGRSIMPGHCTIAVSGHTGLGLGDLWAMLERRSAALLPTDGWLAVNARQRDLLIDAHHNLRDAIDCGDVLIMAEEVRLALRTLGAIVGRSGIETVLDAVFAKFCIGK